LTDTRRLSNVELSRTTRIVCWCLQAVAAVILLQTLYFKFTGAPESVYIFSKLGLEPWGRIGSGVVELVAAVMLLVPRTAVYGAALSAAVIAGAIVSHLTTLGVTLPAVGDRGELFVLALIVMAASAGVLVLRRRELPRVGSAWSVLRR
jgi:uncharacterized membrane protein YphA (DoxX/SURF4 family)